MPEVPDIERADVIFLYTNIGRGHPSYLDGLIEMLPVRRPDMTYFQTDVFALSRGISRIGWNLVKRLYKLGGRGGVITFLYGLLRRAVGSDETGGILYHVLGRDIKRWLASSSAPVVVAHPILARILSDQNRVIYQHGELAAPAEAIVGGCQKILIPLQETADIFKKAGVTENTLVVTGQCIETALAARAEAAYQGRIRRFETGQPLTAALFSSGAYPVEHIRKLRLIAISLFRAGFTVYLFPGQSPVMARRFIHYFRRLGIETDEHPEGEARIKVRSSSSRSEENRQVASIFERFDFFVAPAHERTNWGIGLGLPHFILLPHIGSYAPVNAEIARRCGVSCEISDAATAAELGAIVARMRDEGRLAALARAGCRFDDMAGFGRGAGVIGELIDKSRRL